MTYSSIWLKASLFYGEFLNLILGVWWKSLEGDQPIKRPLRTDNRDSEYLHSLCEIRIQYPSGRSPHVLDGTATVPGFVDKTNKGNCIDK